LDGAEAHGLGLVNDVVGQNDDGDAAFHRSMEIAQLIIPNVRSIFFTKQLLFSEMFCLAVG